VLLPFAILLLSFPLIILPLLKEEERPFEVNLVPAFLVVIFLFPVFFKGTAETVPEIEPATA